MLRPNVNPFSVRFPGADYNIVGLFTFIPHKLASDSVVT